MNINYAPLAIDELTIMINNANNSINRPIVGINRNYCLILPIIGIRCNDSTQGTLGPRPPAARMHFGYRPGFLRFIVPAIFCFFIVLVLTKFEISSKPGLQST